MGAGLGLVIDLAVSLRVKGEVHTVAGLWWWGTAGQGGQPPQAQALEGGA
ncbi:hypothetical protein VITFI_CDS3504 (plasmid) [Vitreoscilla filiformis]|uniref:Uncharacterized protein n=1 Tax=Vitreoscilla filiformis TaxID=63 RepID=A0A221KJR7_VITFI|nr:hypothetical protein VITFI_CDS3504 [Vitreoscilla filiformis]